MVPYYALAPLLLSIMVNGAFHMDLWPMNSEMINENVKRGRYAQFKFVNTAEGFSCYEGFVHELAHILTGEPITERTFPEFVRHLRSIDRRESYTLFDMTEEEKKYCSSPMPLQSVDYIHLSKTVNKVFPDYFDSEKYLKALDYHIKTDIDYAKLDNYIRNNDYQSIQRLVKDHYQAVLVMNRLQSSAKQKVSLKMRLEDYFLSNFKDMKYFTRLLDKEHSSRLIDRLNIGNRPLFPQCANQGLRLSGTSTGGRTPPQNNLSSSSSSSSPSPTSSALRSPICSSPDFREYSEENLEQFKEMLYNQVKKKLSYLRTVIDPMFCSVGLIEHRSLLFTQLMSNQDDAITRARIWEEQKSESAIFVHLRTNDTSRIVVYTSGVNTNCWLIRDKSIIESMNGTGVSEWNVAEHDHIVGISGYNDISVINPIDLIDCRNNGDCMKEYLNQKFSNSSLYSSAFIAAVSSC